MGREHESALWDFGNTVTIIGPSGHSVLGGFERFVFTDGTVDAADGDRRDFDTSSYGAACPDVAAAQVNPLTHFLTYGIREGPFRVRRRRVG